MAAPEQKEAARREPDGSKAGEALREVNNFSPLVKRPPREVDENTVFRIWQDARGEMVVCILDEEEAAAWHAARKGGRK